MSIKQANRLGQVLRALGYPTKTRITIINLGDGCLVVYADDEQLGIWDTVRETFVD